MSGRLDCTPWARAAIPDRAALQRRVPDGHTLHVSTGNRRVFRVALTRPDEGLVVEALGPLDLALDLALDEVRVPVSYMRCSACGKRFGDYGDCDSSSFDEDRHAHCR